MRRLGFTVFIVAALVRFAGVAITTATNLNPDEGADTNQFAASAEAYASGTQSFQFFIESIGSTTATWGFFLSPFWLFPGPSQVYARLAIALVGAYAIYNIYLLIEHYFTTQAGIFAVTPLIFLPSFVALHSVILRDAVILCGLVLAIRMISVPNRFSTRRRYLLATVAIVIASVLRLENLPIYAVMALVGYLTWRVPQKYHFPALSATGVIGLIVYPYLERVFQYIGILGDRSLAEFLIFMRNARIREDGRTQYLVDLPVETLSDILLYAPLGAFYFLFAPLPWMAEIAIDYITAGESLLTMVFALFAIIGFSRLAKRNYPIAIALAVGFLLFVFFYGVISTNVGTSVRQRQPFSWLLFALGGAGIARHINIQLRWNNRIILGTDASANSE